MFMHEIVAKAMQEDGGWFSVKDICKRFDKNQAAAHSIIKRIETCRDYELKTRKEGPIKFVKVQPNAAPKVKQLSRPPLFGIR